MTTNTYINRVYTELEQRLPHETEFLQAVREFLECVEPVVAEHPEYEEQAILERLCWALAAMAAAFVLYFLWVWW